MNPRLRSFWLAMAAPRVRFVLVATLLGSTSLRTQGSTAVFQGQGPLVFTIKDEINSPAYRWPRTLVGYSVDFASAHVRPDQLRLTGEAGATERVQLSDICLKPNGELLTARVHFITGLDPGQSRSFHLACAPADLAPKPPAAERPGVSTNNRGDFFEVDGGPVHVRVPVGRTFAPGDAVPGPIFSLKGEAGWIGESWVHASVARVERLVTEETAMGPLFAEFRLTYFFSGGGQYSATIRVVQGYDHLEFCESMQGLPLEAGAYVEAKWKDYHPTRRFPANGALVPEAGLGIDEPVKTEGTMEEPHWFPPDKIENPSKDMLYRLAAFEGNAPHDAVPVMSFYDDRPGGEELSVFVPNVLGWYDGQYMLWQPTTRLQVHFRYTDGSLFWQWPLVDGRRLTGIALHDTTRGESTVEAVRAVYATLARGHRGAFLGNGSPTIKGFKIRYAQLLRSWYGSLSLDVVKDWVLHAPAEPPREGSAAATEEEVLSARRLAGDVERSQLMLYPLGPDLAVMNISHRSVRPLVDRYLKMRSMLAAEDRRNVDAILLLSAYLNASEEMAPMRICITGTPNMSADGFAIPTEISVLFPEHPMAKSWRNQFQRIIQIQDCYYTRPAVPAWGALGGRWTESLATYNWADLRPITSAQLGAAETDGRNRMADPWMALRAHWLVDELSAPIHNPDPGWRAKGKPPSPSPDSVVERQYPALGAHSTGTGMVVPYLVPLLAKQMMRYDPLAAEHLLWAASQKTSTETGEWIVDERSKRGLELLRGNSGTIPRLVSSKYTGHGLILRAGVGTPEELSIHLDQIDAGPNYRWGDNGEGSSGTLFFFAGGRPWTAVEAENTGDHNNDDTSGLTTFGVVKGGEYRSIGACELDQPLYDLGVAQLATIRARSDREPYSWPAYQSRSVFLVGTDYFILADEATGPSRFTWVTARDLAFPKIVFLSPLGARADHWTETKTRMTKGFMRDNIRGSEGSVALVTHKKSGVEMEGMTSHPVEFMDSADLQDYSWGDPGRPAATAEDGTPAPGVYHIHAPGSHDTLFRAFRPIRFNCDGDADFHGTTGVVRHRTDGTFELALLAGSEIGAGGVVMKVRSEDRVGISAVFGHSARICGEFLAPNGQSPLTIVFLKGNHEGCLYIDGAPATVTWRVCDSGAEFTSELPAGHHTWEFTTGLPTPDSPSVIRTEYVRTGARVFFTRSPSADRCCLEKSMDGERTWTELGTQPLEGVSGSGSFLVEGLSSGKIHIRMTVGNAEHWSSPSEAYPIYLTGKPPLPPDGLDLILKTNAVEASWGEVLGANAYRLYRRTHSAAGPWTLVYQGLKRRFEDLEVPGVVPPAKFPGEDETPEVATKKVIYDYAVSVVDGNGEGPISVPADTDPTGWLNWWPEGKAREFGRLTGYWLPPYVDPDASPPLRYPSGNERNGHE